VKAADTSISGLRLLASLTDVDVVTTSGFGRGADMLDVHDGAVGRSRCSTWSSASWSWCSDLPRRWIVGVRNALAMGATAASASSSASGHQRVRGPNRMIVSVFLCAAAAAGRGWTCRLHELECSG
jgi:hypothetical protein